MLPTNQDLFQLLCIEFSQNQARHEQTLKKWRVHYRKKELEKNYPRFAVLTPTLADWWDRRIRQGISLWCGTRSQVYRMFHRMRYEQAPSANLDITLGFSYQVDATGHWSLDSETQTRILDMQALASNHPWFGVSDQWVYLQAWGAGARWAENNERSSHKESSRPS